MTESEWMTSNDPAAMLRLLDGEVSWRADRPKPTITKSSDRKLRLFAAACVSAANDGLMLPNHEEPPGGWTPLQWAELWASNRGNVQLAAPVATGLLRCIVGNPWRPVVTEHAYLTNANAKALVDAHAHFTVRHGGDGGNEKEAYRRAVERFVFRRDWLTWNNGAVPALAAAIYEERAFERLPILSDALEEAGCVDPEILAHGRSVGPHVRGCWLIDLLLGKS